MDILVDILTVLSIILISTSVTGSNILCSRNTTTWGQGLKNCLEDKGLPMIGKITEKIELNENLHVWTPDYFFVSGYHWLYNPNPERLCGFKYVSSDGRQSNTFYSDCFYNRNLLCWKYGTTASHPEWLNSTWDPVMYCKDWRYFQSTDHISKSGYFWSTKTFLGMHNRVVSSQDKQLLLELVSGGNDILCRAYNKKTNHYFRNCGNKLKSICQFDSSKAATTHFEECRIGYGYGAASLAETNPTETATKSTNIVHQSTSPLLPMDKSNPTSPVQSKLTFSTQDVGTYLTKSMQMDQSKSASTAAAVVSRATFHSLDMTTTQAFIHVDKNPTDKPGQPTGIIKSQLLGGEEKVTIRHDEESTDMRIVAGVTVAAGLLVVAVITTLVFLQRRYGCIQFCKNGRSLSSTKQNKSLKEEDSFGASRAHANLAYVTTDALRISTSQLDICTNAIVEKPKHQMVPTKNKISPLKVTHLQTEGRYGSNVTNHYRSPDITRHNPMSNLGYCQPSEYSFAVEEPPPREQLGKAAANTKQEDEYDTCAVRRLVNRGENIYDTMGNSDCRQNVYDSAYQKPKTQKTQALGNEYGIAETNTSNEDYDCMSRKDGLNGAAENVYNRLY